ncbi:MAG: sugar ABC transporter permease [Clostridiales bacterium]|nr:sugar ABC transporter permease [Clostridiales bacterium]
MGKFLDRRFTLVLMLPALCIAAVLILYPMCYGFYISLFDTNLVNKWEFKGVGNYLALLNNAAFRNSLWVNIQFIVLVVLGHMVIGTVLALQLNKAIKARAFWRCLLMLPWLIPEVVYALLAKWVLNPQYGVFNYTLMSLGIIDAPVAWLGEIATALSSVIVVSILKGYPFTMIMVLSGLQTVSGDLYEAAEMDGCTPWQTFWRITVPSILPVVAVTLILDTVTWFKHYTMVAIMTGGGPAKTTSLVSVTIYKTAFESFKFGQAGAMAVIVFVICYLFGVFYRRLTHES